MIFKAETYIIEKRINKHTPWVLCILLKDDFDSSKDEVAKYVNYFTVTLKNRVKGERIFKTITKEYDDNFGGIVSVEKHGIHVPCKKIINKCNELLNGQSIIL